MAMGREARVDTMLIRVFTGPVLEAMAPEGRFAL
jgi:hypothetical protein